MVADISDKFYSISKRWKVCENIINSNGKFYIEKLDVSFRLSKQQRLE